MSEILFGQSYYLRFDLKLWQAMQPFPPLGTLYAASWLRAHGYDVGLFDAMLAESEAEWEAALARSKPRFAVLYEDNFNYLSKMCLQRMRDAAVSMIGLAKGRGCQTIVCGSDATDHPGIYLAAGADFVVAGEGEVTLLELLDSLTGRSQARPESIAGLNWAGGSTGRRADIRDLDGLPFPAWDLVDVDRYRRIWRERHGTWSANMVTTRGCPFHCNWCAKPIWGQRYHARSPENVVAEMRWLKETVAPDRIWFADDIFGLKPGWLPRFAEQVQAEGAAIPFKCLSRVDLLARPGEIEALRQADCDIVWVGAESGSQQVLDAMEKGTQVEQIYAAARDLHAAGVRVGFFLQFGYPGETRADVEKTLQMVRDCRPDDIGMSVSYPLPGTKFFASVREQLGVRQNWVDSSDLAMLYQGPYATGFYRQLHRVLHKEFRARKAWQAIRAGKIRPRHVRALAGAASLPLERWRLDRLARPSEGGVGPLLPALSPEQAARPTIQIEVHR